MFSDFIGKFRNNNLSVQPKVEEQEKQNPNCFRKFLITNDMSHILFSLHRKDQFYQQAIDILPELDNNGLKFLIQKLTSFCKAPVTKPDNESDDEYRDRLSQLISEVTKNIKN